MVNWPSPPARSSGDCGGALRLPWAFFPPCWVFLPCWAGSPIFSFSTYVLDVSSQIPGLCPFPPTGPCGLLRGGLGVMPVPGRPVCGLIDAAARAVVTCSRCCVWFLVRTVIVDCLLLFFKSVSSVKNLFHRPSKISARKLQKITT